MWLISHGSESRFLAWFNQMDYFLFVRAPDSRKGLTVHSRDRLSVHASNFFGELHTPLTYTGWLWNLVVASSLFTVDHIIFPLVKLQLPVSGEFWGSLLPMYLFYSESIFTNYKRKKRTHNRGWFWVEAIYVAHKAQYSDLILIHCHSYLSTYTDYL